MTRTGKHLLPAIACALGVLGLSFVASVAVLVAADHRPSDLRVCDGAARGADCTP